MAVDVVQAVVHHHYDLARLAMVGTVWAMHVFMFASDMFKTSASCPTNDPCCFAGLDKPRLSARNHCDKPAWRVGCRGRIAWRRGAD